MSFMPIPKTNDLFYDVLVVMKDGQRLTRPQIRSMVIPRLNLTPDELAAESNKGGALVNVRINWAVSHLAQAGAITRPEKGVNLITGIGLELLNNSNGRIEPQSVRDLPAYQDWMERSKLSAESRKANSSSKEQEALSPELDTNPYDLLIAASEAIRLDVASELLDRIRNMPPEFLEKLILKLLLAMGYAASEEDLDHTGGPGDEGIDGIVRQDALGLEKIYIQAKRYREQGTISGETVQAFIGALSVKNATRGVFITTSRFSPSAQNYVEKLTGQSVVLIDGQELVSHMISAGVGVSTLKSIPVFAIDENFFSEDQS